MILIADSGSTKTSWCLIDPSGKHRYFSSDGINPFFRTSENIIEELKKNLLPKIHNEVQQIFFYGAGIINREKGDIVKNALQKLFANAQIEIQSDLLAAARATLGNQPGIACILGTGSNSCFYNGVKIEKNVPPLGFILGDEGSGTVLGKKLLADYLKGIMPENITSKFKSQYPLSYAENMEAVYKKEKPNSFLARFVPFIAENISEKYCTNLVETSFNEFLDRNILQYKDYKTLAISFVGSLAFHFQNQLQEVMLGKHLHIKTIVKEPMQGLITYHSKK